MKRRFDPKLPIPPVAGDDPAVAAYKPDRFGDRLLRRLNELFREFDGTVSVFDEGIYLGEADGLNFVGTPVTASQSTTLPAGIYDITVTGGGSGVPTMSVVASEALSPGDYVNVYNASGSARARKAKASAAGYEAFGWTDATVNASATATIGFLGVNSHNSGLTPGAVFLSNTAGQATSVCPTGAGHVAQQIGVAETATDVAFEWNPAVLMAATHSAGAGITLQDEGVTLGTIDTINFVGAAVTATISSSTGIVTVSAALQAPTIYVYFA